MKSIFFLLFSTSVMAAPASLEVWFLSASKVSQLESILNKSDIRYSKPIALACQEMGDFCFDPQYGLYKKDHMEEDVSAQKIIEDKGPVIPTAHSVDRDLISCDPNNYFDIYCGKARAIQAAKTKIDIWVDTSSSMREVDFSDKEGGCYRKSLLKRLDDDCGFNQKVNVMMFDTSIKQAGGLDSLCQNVGLNDYKRLIDWIERSDAQKLIVITDIYELHKEFADYIESKHGKLRGDKDRMTAAEMLSQVDGLAKSCK